VRVIARTPPSAGLTHAFGERHFGRRASHDLSNKALTALEKGRIRSGFPQRAHGLLSSGVEAGCSVEQTAEALYTLFLCWLHWNRDSRGFQNLVVLIDTGTPFARRP
jgi:hypothetical protein